MGQRHCEITCSQLKEFEVKVLVFHQVTPDVPGSQSIMFFPLQPEEQVGFCTRELTTTCLLLFRDRVTSHLPLGWRMRSTCSKAKIIHQDQAGSARRGGRAWSFSEQSAEALNQFASTHRRTVAQQTLPRQPPCENWFLIPLRRQLIFLVCFSASGA